MALVDKTPCKPDYAAELNGVIAKMFRENGLGAKAIAARASEIGGEPISTATIESYTRGPERRDSRNAEVDGTEKRHRTPPAYRLHILEAACNSTAVTEHFCELAGGAFLDKCKRQEMEYVQAEKERLEAEIVLSRKKKRSRALIKEISVGQWSLFK